MTNRIDHTDCLHEATSKDRAACRKAKADTSAALALAVATLLEVFASRTMDWDSDTKWVFYAARRFASYEGSDATEAATAVLSYFAPSGDEDRDRNRKANGYTITTDPHTMVSITLRAAS